MESKRHSRAQLDDRNRRGTEILGIDNSHFALVSIAVVDDAEHKSLVLGIANRYKDGLTGGAVFTDIVV